MDGHGLLQGNPWVRCTVVWPCTRDAGAVSASQGHDDRGAMRDQRGHAVPLTTQTRLTFEVVLPLWLNKSAVSTLLKSLRLGVYWIAREWHGLYPEER
jgi:hypothetical protein